MQEQDMLSLADEVVAEYHQKSAESADRDLNMIIARHASELNLDRNGIDFLVPLVNKSYLRRTGADTFKCASSAGVVANMYAEPVHEEKSAYLYAEYFGNSFEPMVKSAGMENTVTANQFERSSDISGTLRQLSNNDVYAARVKVASLIEECENLMGAARELSGTIKMLGVTGIELENALFNAGHSQNTIKSASALLLQSPVVKAASAGDSYKLYHDAAGKITQLGKTVDELLVKAADYREANDHYLRCKARKEEVFAFGKVLI